MKAVAVFLAVVTTFLLVDTLRLTMLQPRFLRPAPLPKQEPIITYVPLGPGGWWVTTYSENGLGLNSQQVVTWPPVPPPAPLVSNPAASFSRQTAIASVLSYIVCILLFCFGDRLFHVEQWGKKRTPKQGFAVIMAGVADQPIPLKWVPPRDRARV